MPSPVQIAIIGSGVVGLTTALEIQKRGYAVTIFAESLPGDEKSTRFTSPWAAAHHVSGVPDYQRQHEFERETFKRLWDASGEDSEEAHCLMRTTHREYYAHDMVGKTGLEWMPDFRPLTQEELIAPAICGVTFTTVNIDTAVYLPFLLARFLTRGGRIRRVHVQHIDQVLLGSWGMPVPDALVVCAGIGARSLGGVEDPKVYPIRGQTALIRAPWVHEGRTLTNPGGDITYIVPRRSGDVVLGGTRGADDWYPHPRPETGRAILTRTLKLMPNLAPSGRVEDLEALVIEHGCGLRPGRKDGVRLESGVVQVGSGVEGRAVPVVYNYGHAGAGYQGSWGTAHFAAELLVERLQEIK